MRRGDLLFDRDSSDEEKLLQYNMLAQEANLVREKDKVLVRSLFQNFYDKQLRVGIGYQRAFGSILAGDYFDLIKLPDGNFLFIFADISGHGLPAYTTLIRLRSAVTIAIRDIRNIHASSGRLDSEFLVRRIVTTFTDIMDDANSSDFACVNFTFIQNDHDKFHLKFYNRSMLFPVVIRRFRGSIVDVYNLNRAEKGWVPLKGHLMGSDVRHILGAEYDDSPFCDFTVFEGDSIIFFSDGIIEANGDTPGFDEYGEERLIEYLRDNDGIDPQLLVGELLGDVYEFIGSPQAQKDDMTAILIDFPPVRI